MTIKPAEADAEAMVRRAEGDRAARIAIAEAEARRVELAGEAEARIIMVKGQAVAEALGMKAEAYQRFNQAAVLAVILESMPAIVSAAAEPIGNIDSLTVLSTDGASEVVRTTTETVAQANATIKSLTGIDMAALIGSVVPAQAPKGGGRSGLTRHLGDGFGAQAGKAAGQAGQAGKGARGGGAAPAGTPQAKPPAKPAAAPAGVAVPTASAPVPASAPVAPAPAPKPLAEQAPVAAAPVSAAAAAAAAAAQAPQAVDAVLREVAGRLRALPLSNDPWVRTLNLSVLGTKAPGPVREIWIRYGQQVPDSYRSLTIGELLDRYGQ